MDKLDPITVWNSHAWGHVANRRSSFEILPKRNRERVRRTESVALLRSSWTGWHRTRSSLWPSEDEDWYRSFLDSQSQQLGQHPTAIIVNRHSDSHWPTFPRLNRRLRYSYRHSAIEIDRSDSLIFLPTLTAISFRYPSCLWFTARSTPWSRIARKPCSDDAVPITRRPKALPIWIAAIPTCKQLGTRWRKIFARSLTPPLAPWIKTVSFGFAWPLGEMMTSNNSYLQPSL